MKTWIAALVCSLLLLPTISTFAESNSRTFITYADGRKDGGIRQAAAGDGTKDSPGNIFVFDQKLLAHDIKTVIGRNAGFCVRTDPGAPDFSGTDHPSLPDDPKNNYGQCTWTLSFSNNSDHKGTITVSGREADIGSSEVAIIGGTGDFAGARGVLISTPKPQGKDGVLFRQELIISPK